MPRTRETASDAPSPEAMLRKATMARSSTARAKYARKGLAAHRVDRSTRAMLLRQLYLAHVEGRRFEQALAIAQEMAALDVMADVARQDAARAQLGLGDVDGAVSELRMASRVGPPSRRAFHLWTLGSVLYVNGRPEDAIGAFERAARWGTRDKPLYRAQLALAKLAAGEPTEDLQALKEHLEQVPCGRGYGEFVLGELAFRLGLHREAHEYLDRFITRTESGRVALEIALRGEVERARELLRSLARAAGPSPGIPESR